MNRIKNKKIAVVGLGNPLMGDESIGVHVVRELERFMGVIENVDLFEAGISPMSMVHMIANRNKAILIDCARMGRNPGEICRFSPQEVISIKSLPALSLHEGDFLNSLAISRKIGECPQDVVILGIEPYSITFGERISYALQERSSEYVEVVLEEIRGRGAGLQAGEQGLAGHVHSALSFE